MIPIPFRKRNIPAAAVLSAALLVAACEGTPDLNTPGGGHAPPPQSATQATQGSAPMPALSSLSGQSWAQVTALLGAPGFTRQDDPAEIWQYRGASCFLDVFLYREKGGNAYRVRHAETRSRTDKTVSETDCFAGLINARRKEKGG